MHLYKFSWHDAKKQTPNFNFFQNLIGPILTQTMYIYIICIYIYPMRQRPPFVRPRPCLKRKAQNRVPL
jgi:hypothetical protein